MSEAAIIQHYRQELMRTVDKLTECLSDFDAQPDEYSLALQLRDHRKYLDEAVDIYYAALGARDPESIPKAGDIASRVDARLRALDEEVQGEVTRFEYTADAIASCFHPKLTQSAIADLCVDANELLLEVSVYRTGWDLVIQETCRTRLDIVQSKLYSILDSSPKAKWTPAPVAGFPLPGVEMEGEFSESSSDDGTYASKISPSARVSSAIRPRDGLQHHTNSLGGTTAHAIGSEPRGSPNLRSRHTINRPEDELTSKMSVVADPRFGSPANRRDSMQTMILSRSRTLQDMAATARSSDRMLVNENVATAAAENMFSEYAQLAADEGPSLAANSALRSSPPRSFASMLYNTHNARSSPVSDTGKSFQRSVVRGDGRCLFRSVARARAVGRGKAVPSERAERDMADELRHRAVVELKRNKELLQQFYVIEADFESYAKRMSSPRTFGGEPELLMLAKIIHAPIGVYICVKGRYKQIQVYGRQYRGEPIRILYSDGVHYDALLEIGS
jgi:OTU-like cysteine protease